MRRAPSPADPADLREWTVDGRAVSARFSGLADGRLMLKTADGITLRIELGRVAEADRAWIEARKKARQTQKRIEPPAARAQEPR